MCAFLSRARLCLVRVSTQRIDRGCIIGFALRADDNAHPHSCAIRNALRKMPVGLCRAFTTRGLFRQQLTTAVRTKAQSRILITLSVGFHVWALSDFRQEDDHGALRGIAT